MYRPTFELAAESVQMRETVPDTVAFAAGLVMLTCAHAGTANSRDPTKKPIRLLFLIILARIPL
jgi:hypothetical protein